MGMSKSSWVLRMLGKCGHDVWIAEIATYRFNHTQFSKFCRGNLVLPRPEKDYKKWLSELRKIVEDLRIDLLIPCTSPVESKYYATLEKEGLPCKILFIQGESCDILDDKARFAQYCKENGLASPETHRINNRSQVEEIVRTNPEQTYILKPIEYDPVLRLDLQHISSKRLSELDGYLESRGISKNREFVLQELLNADTEYGCFCLAWEGTLLAFTFFPSDPSCLVYETAQKSYDEVLDFCKVLSKSMNLTGMFTVDFLPNSAGKLLPIEANPRIHSGCVVLSDSPHIGHVIAGTKRDKVILCRDVLKPKQKYYWAFDQLLKRLGFWKSGISLPASVWLSHRWALWDPEDPWVFFGMYHCQIVSLLLHDLWNGELEWTKIDFCIGKIVKVGGD